MPKFITHNTPLLCLGMFFLGNGCTGAGTEDAAGIPEQPNILLYVVDSLRADRPGRGLTPTLDRFAETSQVFTQSRAHAAWTRPSVATLFTGLWPHQHGALVPGVALDDEFDTLAERLQAAGYHTGAFVTNGIIPADMGFDQGFDTYEMLEGSTGNYASSHILNAAATTWLAQAQPPFFLYLHSNDPHFPYVDNPDEVGGMDWLLSLWGGDLSDAEQYEAALLDAYDREVSRNDRTFGDLLDALDETGMAEETVVVFTADHGEEFYDHEGWAHGQTLYGELLDVPLMIRIPWRRAKAQRVGRHIDVMPTLLASAQVSSPVPLPGVDLCREVAPDVSFGHLQLEGLELLSVEQGDLKMIQDLSTGTTLTYDRAVDPGEQNPITSPQPALEALIEMHLAP